MLNSKYKNIIENNVGKNKIIGIDRNKIDNRTLYGVPLVLKENLLLIQYEYDYIIDGYKIIQLSDITSVKAGKMEKFNDYIFENEGKWKEIHTPSVQKINTWQEALQELQKLGVNIAVECEGDKNIFVIGKINEIGQDSVILLCFDALGNWDKATTEIIYCDITCISFNNNYTKTLSKYLKN